jgi:hypothetical protein
MLTLMVVLIASSVKVISKGTGLEATLKLKEDMTISVQKKKGNTSRENMDHYGYASSLQNPGPFVHAVVRESKEHDKLVFPKTVKLLHEYKGISDGICDLQKIVAAVKSIGNDILKSLTKNSNVTHALTKHKDWCNVLIIFILRYQ